MKIFKYIKNANEKIGKSKYLMMILYWLIFLLITVDQFYKFHQLKSHLHTRFPETLGHEIRLDNAQLLLIIAFYLMFSTIVVSIKDNKVKGCYYGVAIALIVVAYPLIEKYYYLNSFFTGFEGHSINNMVLSINFGLVWNPYGIFFNPSLLPFLISIVILIIPCISTYLNSLNDE